MVTPTSEQLIRPTEEGFPGWESIAQELAGEVTRLRAEVDRLKKGDSNAPIASKADWTHPLFGLWVELGLDNLPGLIAAWEAVQMNFCPKCNTPMEPFMDGNACHDCGLLWVLYLAGKHGSLGLDTIERAQERGPD